MRRNGVQSSMVRKAVRLPGAVLATAFLAAIGCGNSPLDANKFAGIQAGGQSVRADLITSGGGGSPELARRVETFARDVTAAGSRVAGTHEKAALAAFASAAEAYKYFLRFRELDSDATGMILLRGANRPIAFRYALLMQERGGGRWVRRQTALEIFRGRGDASLADAAAIVARTGR